MVLVGKVLIRENKTRKEKWFELPIFFEEIVESFEWKENANVQLSIIGYDLPFKINKPKGSAEEIIDNFSDLFNDFYHHNSSAESLILDDYSVDDIIRLSINMNIEVHADIVHISQVVNMLMDNLEAEDLMRVKRSLSNVSKEEEYYFIDGDVFFTIDEKMLEGMRGEVLVDYFSQFNLNYVPE